MTSQEVKAATRQSLGLPPVEESKPTVPVEGHVCDFPLWSFSKKRSSQTRLHIDYDDSSFLTIEAPKGMPSLRFPGYLDVILFYGQRDLFLQDHTSMSVYSILQTLGMDPTNGMNYEYFRRDLHRAFYMGLETDRFRHPSTGQRSHVAYFRVLRQMFVAKNRREVSTFYFDDLFIASLRAGYLKRLDWEYCLDLDREGEALVRFLYGHLTKRIGEKSLYMRRLPGFLSDIGLGYLLSGEPKRVTETLKRTVYPALDRLQGIAYRLDESSNLVFAPMYPQN
jgi:hypothetical protein